MTENITTQLPEQQQEEDSLNLYAIIFKYLVYWPWFVTSVLVCLIGTFIYLRYQTPVYNISSSVLIKEQDNNLVQILVLMYAVVSILGVFLGDLLLAFVDPRIKARYTKKGAK